MGKWQGVGRLSRDSGHTPEDKEPGAAGPGLAGLTEWPGTERRQTQDLWTPAVAARFPQCLFTLSPHG